MVQSLQSVHMQPSVYEHFNNMCLHIVHMQSLRGAGYATLHASYKVSEKG